MLFARGMLLAFRDTKKQDLRLPLIAQRKNSCDEEKLAIDYFQNNSGLPRNLQ
jgi:hypothetical protein